MISERVIASWKFMPGLLPVGGIVIRKKPRRMPPACSACTAGGTGRTDPFRGADPRPRRSRRSRLARTHFRLPQSRRTSILFLFFVFPLEIIRYDAIVYDTSIVVGVAQLVERLTVAQNVAGSSPVSHPIRIDQDRKSSSILCDPFFFWHPEAADRFRRIEWPNGLPWNRIPFRD